MNIKGIDFDNMNLHSKSGIIEIAGALGSILGKINPDDSLRLKYDILDSCVKIVHLVVILAHACGKMKLMTRKPLQYYLFKQLDL